jgi:putative iron-dependent peroxidase
MAESSTCYTYSFLESSGFPAAAFPDSPVACIAQLGAVARANVSNALFTTIALHDEFLQSKDKVNKLLSALKQLSAITESVMEKHDRGMSSRLTSVVAVDCRLWFVQWHYPVASSVVEIQRARAAPAADASNDTAEHKAASDPLFFEPIYSKDGSKLIFDQTHSHILLFVKSHRADLNYEVTRRFLELAGCMPSVSSSQSQPPQYTTCHTFAFRYLDGRDLTGFIYGSQNAGGSLRSVSTCLVSPEAASSSSSASPTACKGGGSFVLASRFVHDLPLFDSLSVAAKSDLMGRDYGRVENATLAYAADGQVENPLMEIEPNDCHIQRANKPDDCLLQRALYRQSFPYLGETGNHGLFFIAFASNPFVFKERLCSMAGHTGFGSHDKLLNVTKPESANIYYAPSLLELIELNDM